MAIPSGAFTANGAVGAATFGLSTIAKGIAALYGTASDLNDFLDRHIQDMQSSANPTIAGTGRILEGAKLGFGLGYISSVTIIAVGQYLLGNTWTALATVATAATLSNPIAMTCAAVGAILYGWGALSDKERNDILDRLAKGLDIGVELIRSVINFVIQFAREVFGSKVLKEFKAYIADTAALFGRSLSDVTHLTVDVVSDAASSVKAHANLAIAETAKVASEASSKVGEAFSDLRLAAGDAIDQTGEAAKQVVEEGKRAIRRVRSSRASK